MGYGRTFNMMDYVSNVMAYLSLEKLFLTRNLNRELSPNIIFVKQDLKYDRSSANRKCNGSKTLKIIFFTLGRHLLCTN